MLANMYLSRKQAWKLEGSLHPTGGGKKITPDWTAVKGAGGNEDTGLLVLVVIFFHMHKKVNIYSMVAKLLLYKSSLQTMVTDIL